MKYQYCLKCGYPVDCEFIDKIFLNYDKFCKNCGQPTKTKIETRCEKGHSMSKGHKFCEKCGAKADFILTPDGKILSTDKNDDR
jgi:hypothetical protein